MKLTVFSHKETWVSSNSPSGYVTVGGFPFQMRAISELFDSTTIVVPIRETVVPKGARPLDGHNLKILPLKEPTGKDFRRKVSWLTWLPNHMAQLWQTVKSSDAVHVPIPGDIGTFAIFLALIAKNPLFIRHCGNWYQPISPVDQFLHWLLEHIAGGRNVVMATGGGKTSPSPKNSEISWIFSTTLTKRTLAQLPMIKPWGEGEILRLITVGRLSSGKNIHLILQAVQQLQQRGVQTHLDILGDGSYKEKLRELISQLEISNGVTFHGNVSHEQVFRFLSKAHIFVFPSRSEGFPKAVLEALACGLPVVSSDVSVLPILVKESGSGITLSDITSEKITQAILGLLSDQELLIEMSRNARETAQQYTLERWQDKIGDRLESTWGRSLRDHG